MRSQLLRSSLYLVLLSSVLSTQGEYRKTQLQGGSSARTGGGLVQWSVRDELGQSVSVSCVRPAGVWAWRSLDNTNIGVLMVCMLN